MTGQYLMIDTHENRSTEPKVVDKALTEVNLAVLEIEDEYDSNIPVVKRT